jgi:hypothetical protein
MVAIRSLLLLSLMAISCFAQSVNYNFDHNADFSKFKTYKWEDKQYNAYSTGVGPGWGYGPGWGRGYGYGGPTNTTVQTTTIHIGELALDMYDAAEKKLVWRGEASKTLDEKAKPEKRQKNLQKAVAKLLKDYPPPVKK